MIWEYTVLTVLLLQCCKEFTNLFWTLLILLQLPDAGYFWEPPAPARGGGKPMWSVGLDAVGSYNQQPRYVAVRGEGISLTISIHKANKYNLQKSPKNMVNRWNSATIKGYKKTEKNVPECTGIWDRPLYFFRWLLWVWRGAGWWSRAAWGGRSRGVLARRSAANTSRRCPGRRRSPSIAGP